MKGRQSYTEWEKPSASFLTFPFLFSSFGFRLYAHDCFCHGVSLSFFTENKCSCTHSISANVSCKEKSCFLKINGKYCATEIEELNFSKAIPFASPFPVAYDSYLNQKNKQIFYHSGNSPPFLSLPLFISHRSILI